MYKRYTKAERLADLKWLTATNMIDISLASQCGNTVNRLSVCLCQAGGQQVMWGQQTQLTH